MAKKYRIRNFLKNTFNVKAWLGYQHLKSGANIITSVGRVVTDVSSASAQYPSEQFDEAVARLNLSDAELQKYLAGYYRNFLIFFLLGTLMALYSIYRFYNGELVSGFISLCITVVSYVFSLAMHFWYFQIRHRKLGCTFNEWFNHRIN